MKKLSIDILLVAHIMGLIVALNTAYLDDNKFHIIGPGYGSTATNRQYIVHGIIFVLIGVWLLLIPLLQGRSNIAHYLSRTCKNKDIRVYYALSGIASTLGAASIIYGAMKFGVPNP